MTCFFSMLAGYALALWVRCSLARTRSGAALAALGAAHRLWRRLALGLTVLVHGGRLRAVYLGSTNADSSASMLRLDGLSAFFLIVIGLVGLAVAIYGFSYTAAYAGRYSLRLLGVLLNVLLAVALLAGDGRQRLHAF